jgi:hypothetical protein
MLKRGDMWRGRCYQTPKRGETDKEALGERTDARQTLVLPTLRHSTMSRTQSPWKVSDLTARTWRLHWMKRRLHSFSTGYGMRQCLGLGLEECEWFLGRTHPSGFKTKQSGVGLDAENKEIVPCQEYGRNIWSHVETPWIEGNARGQVVYLVRWKRCRTPETDIGIDPIKA